MKRILHRIARIKKIKSKELIPSIDSILHKYLGTNSKPCILKVRLPIKYVANKHRIGTDMEIYTEQKVPFKYVLACLSIADTEQTAKIIWRKK